MNEHRIGLVDSWRTIYYHLYEKVNWQRRRLLIKKLLKASLEGLSNDDEIAGMAKVQNTDSDSFELMR